MMAIRASGAYEAYHNHSKLAVGRSERDAHGAGYHGQPGREPKNGGAGVDQDDAAPQDAGLPYKQIYHSSGGFRAVANAEPEMEGDIRQANDG